MRGTLRVSVAIQHINSIPLSPRELDPTIPEALEAITMKAMAPNPDNRYPSADAMLADLEEFRKNPSINFDYDVSEFVPEEPEEGAMTQIRTPHTPVRSRVPEPEPRRRRYEEPEEEEEEPENRPRAPGTAGGEGQTGPSSRPSLSSWPLWRDCSTSCISSSSPPF